jgi:4-hydroxybenzoate polyprenyltransferase
MWTMRATAERVRLCWVEARPIVQLIFMLRFLAGVVLSWGAGVPLGRALVGLAGWCCATFAVYVYNGIADRVEDVANGSTRPIARGDLSERFATGAVLVGAVIGCLTAVWLGHWMFAAMLGYLLVGYAYSGPPFPLKQTYYAASIGGGSLGLLTYLGGALCAGRPPSAAVLVFAVMMSLWMGGVGGIAKDLPDEKGDRAAGRRTWPVVFGERRARQLLVVSAPVVAVAFWFTAAAYSTKLLWCSAAVCLGAVALMVVSMGAREREGSGRRLPYRVFMWTQYLSHTVLAGVVLGTLHP